MADLNLVTGVESMKQFDGNSSLMGNKQKIRFYCLYSSSGVLTIKLKIFVDTANFDTSHAYANITVGGTKTTFLDNDPLEIGKNVEKQIGVATRTYTAQNSSISVNAFLNIYSGGYGPTPSGGTNFSFTISVPGVISNCTAPSSFTVSPTNATPAGSATLTWSGATGGNNNSIVRYFVQYSANNGSWTDTSPYNLATSSGSGSLKITLPNLPGSTLKFRIRTEGSAGSNYYSGYKESSNSCTLYSSPFMSVCQVSHSNGTTNISWSAGSAGVNNPISSYNIYYSYKTSSNASWSSRFLIANVGNSQRSYQWSGGTTGYYYRIAVVAVGSNYSTSSELWSNQFIRQASYTACTSPSSLSCDKESAYIGENVTLSWTTGGNGINNAVSGYEISSNLNNSGWTVIANVGVQLVYSYNLPTKEGTIKYRIRTRGTAGNNYYSEYFTSEEYSIIMAPAPMKPSTPILASLSDYGDLGDKSFKISWDYFIGNEYNPVKENGYNLYYYESPTIDDSDFGNRVLIASNIRTYLSESPYEWHGGDWGKYYKFSVIATGLYGGVSEELISNAVLKDTEDPIAPNQFEIIGLGYNKNLNRLIPGLQIQIKPLNSSNAELIELQYRKTKDGISSNWMNISNDLSPNEYSKNIRMPDDFSDNDYINIRARSRAIDGTFSNYYPETEEDLVKNRIYFFDPSVMNKEYPIIQIKRAEKEIIDREDRLESGIRIKDGEFFYDSTNRVLKIGSIIDNNSENKFSELPSLFGKLEIGTGNSADGENSVSIGTGNSADGENNLVIGKNNSSNKIYSFLVNKRDLENKTFEINDVSDFQIGDNIIIYYYLNGMNQVQSTVSQIDLENNILTLSYEETLPETGNLYIINTERNIGDYYLVTSSQNIIGGENNSIYGSNNLLIGSNNTIDESVYVSLPSNSIVFGRYNTIKSSFSGSIMGGSNNIGAASGIAVFGNNNDIRTPNTLAVGNSLKSSSQNSLHIGEYNNPSENSKFTIGDGNSENNRKNILEVTDSKTQINNSLYYSISGNGVLQKNSDGLIGIASSSFVTVSVSGPNGISHSFVFRKFGTRVDVSGAGEMNFGTVTASNGWYQIGANNVIPEGYRPVSSLTYAALAYNQNCAGAFIQFKPDGSIHLWTPYTSGNTTGVMCNIAYTSD